MKPLHLIFALVTFSSCILAQPGSDHWVSTWATSPQQPRAFPAPRPAAATTSTTPAPARPAPITSFHNQTIRMIAHTSIGGRRVRIELSNVFGSAPLVIGAAHIALRDQESAIVPASDKALSFSGHPTAWIPPGAIVISDAVDPGRPHRERSCCEHLYVPDTAWD